MTGSQATPEDEDPLIASLREFLEANRSLQRALQMREARIEGYIAALEAGDRAVDLARASPAVAARTTDNQAIDRLTKARQKSRARTFHRLIKEGMSRKEIAEIWGFSQQVVSRIVNYERVPVDEEPAR